MATPTGAEDVGKQFPFPEEEGWFFPEEGRRDRQQNRCLLWVRPSELSPKKEQASPRQTAYNRALQRERAAL